MSEKNNIELLREYKKFYIDVSGFEELLDCDINISWNNMYAELYVGDSEDCLTLYPESLEIDYINEEKNCIEFDIDCKYRLFGYR